MGRPTGLPVPVSLRVAAGGGDALRGRRPGRAHSDGARHAHLVVRVPPRDRRALPAPPLHCARPPGVRAIRAAGRLRLHARGPRRSARRVRRSPGSRSVHARGARFWRADWLAAGRAPGVAGAQARDPQLLRVAAGRRPGHGPGGKDGGRCPRPAALQVRQRVAAPDHAVGLWRQVKADQGDPSAVPRGVPRPRGARPRPACLGEGPARIARALPGAVHRARRRARAGVAAVGHEGQRVQARSTRAVAS